MQFRNPANDYIEEYNPNTAWLWCFLFGVFYWIFRGNVRHAITYVVITGATCGLAWLIYPFFANQINISHYGRTGWKQEEPTIGEPRKSCCNFITKHPTWSSVIATALILIFIGLMLSFADSQDEKIPVANKPAPAAVTTVPDKTPPVVTKTKKTTHHKKYLKD